MGDILTEIAESFAEYEPRFKTVDDFAGQFLKAREHLHENTFAKLGPIWVEINPRMDKFKISRSADGNTVSLEFIGKIIFQGAKKIEEEKPYLTCTAVHEKGGFRMIAKTISNLAILDTMKMAHFNEYTFDSFLDGIEILEKAYLAARESNMNAYKITYGKHLLPLERKGTLTVEQALGYITVFLDNKNNFANEIPGKSGKDIPGWVVEIDNKFNYVIMNKISCYVYLEEGENELGKTAVIKIVNEKLFVNHIIRAYNKLVTVEQGRAAAQWNPVLSLDMGFGYRHLPINMEQKLLTTAFRIEIDEKHLNFIFAYNFGTRDALVGIAIDKFPLGTAKAIELGKDGNPPEHDFEKVYNALLSNAIKDYYNLFAKY